MASPCDTCPDPGACCRGFQLSIDFPVDAHVFDVEERMRSDGMPFLPLEPSTYKDGPEGTKRWLFSCPELNPDGRCGIVDDRTKCCRDYRPAEDGLCVLHDDGLPIYPSSMHQEILH